MDLEHEIRLSIDEAYKLIESYYLGEGEDFHSNINQPLNRFDWSKVSLEKKRGSYGQFGRYRFTVLDKKKFAWNVIKYGIKLS